MQRAVLAAAAGQVPSEPIQRAHILIERHGVRAPDPDNLVGGAKRLIDCLTTPRLLNVRTPGARPRVKNKRGLGFVVDDGPDHVTLDVRHVPARLCCQKTVVTITEKTP
ncbi:MAG: holliday junction resolvase [Caudoviricetes sp.]|nr:MAG: holliday junction resolvase [Caudoviricetes sp.]